MEALHFLIRLIHECIVGFVLSYSNDAFFLMHLSVNSIFIYM